MKKYLINDDDLVRVEQKLYHINYNNPNLLAPLTCKQALKDYSERDNKAEIFQHGHDYKTVALNEGDTLANTNNPNLEFVVIGSQLMLLVDAEYIVNNCKGNHKVIKLSSSHPNQKEEQEFDKRDKQMTKDIDTLKSLVENAEGQGWETIDGVNYGASHTWREIAQLALDLADQQEWFDRYDAKYMN